MGGGGLSQGSADPQDDAQIPPPTLLEHQLLGKLMLYKMLSGRSPGQINSSPASGPDPIVENSHELTHPQEHPLFGASFLPPSNLTAPGRTSRNSLLLLLWGRGWDPGWGIQEPHCPGHKEPAGRGTQRIFLLHLEGEMPLHPQSWNQEAGSWNRHNVLFSLLQEKPTYTGTE